MNVLRRAKIFQGLGCSLLKEMKNIVMDFQSYLSDSNAV